LVSPRECTGDGNANGASDERLNLELSLSGMSAVARD